MLLEFVIPYYGSADLFINSLSSVFKQKDPSDYGIIIVNDNGGKAELVEETSKVKKFLDMMMSVSSIPITYIENEHNSGPGVSRNNGLAVSSAEYISFMDSDDFLNEEFVSILKKEIAKNEDSELVVGSCVAVRSETEALQIGQDIITWIHSKAYKREFLIKYDIYFPNLRMNEDSGFNAIVYELVEKITYYQGTTPMYYWMQNIPNSLTSIGSTRPYVESIALYIESILFAYEKVFKYRTIDELNRIQAQIFQVYLFYCELMYRGEDYSLIEPLVQRFFDMIHHTKWYQSQQVKDKIATYAISQNILGPMIPEITFAQFVKKFEGEPLNFR